MLTTTDLFDLNHSLAGSYLAGFSYPWQALSGIRDLILELSTALDDSYIEISPQVWVHRSASIAPSAFLGAPCIIGAGTEIRHCAFIRGSALVGENCVVGNSVELKNVILFDNVQVPHFNYVGDSILGYKSHMGAGAVTSNVKSDQSLVVVKNGDEKIETGLKKFGAILGDHVEVEGDRRLVREGADEERQGDRSLPGGAGCGAGAAGWTGSSLRLRPCGYPQHLSESLRMS